MVVGYNRGLWESKGWAERFVAGAYGGTNEAAICAKQLRSRCVVTEAQAGMPVLLEGET
jgi:hypothetical protein